MSPEHAFVPIVDIEPFRIGADPARDSVARAVAAACETSGFLVIVGHGVPASVVAEMYSSTRSFFALPMEEKIEVAVGAKAASPNGYRPPESSALARSLDQDSPPDLCEFFSINRFAAATDPNQWPARPAGFEAAWKAYYGALEQLAATMMAIFARALGLPDDWFAAKIDEHCTALFANHYPAQERAPRPGQLRLGPHTDFGSLTIVYQDDAPGGLQVCEPDGAWRDVPFVSGAFVVNIGDLMARWTNDRWVSTLHRVVNPSRAEAARERLSIPFFHQPNEDAIIECIPTCADEAHPPKYEPVTSGEWRAAKVAKSRAYQSASG